MDALGCDQTSICQEFGAKYTNKTLFGSVQIPSPC